MDRKETLTREFFDTEVWYRSTEKLRRAVRKTRNGSTFYGEGERVYIPGDVAPKKGEIVLTKETVVDTALTLGREFPSSRIAVLNFASAQTPGGGVRRGIQGREEMLCRCSTLYPDLAVQEYRTRFYGPNRSGGSIYYTDACIYSPEVIIVKRETTVQVERLAEEEWQKIDVVSYTSPNLRALEEDHIPLPESESLVQLYAYRAMKVMAVAASQGCDILLTGASGCGGYHNPPELVARGWHNALGELGTYFDQVVFQIPDSRRSSEVYDTFQEILS